ncbi:MAG: radical SAM protein [Bacteroidales bacterium]|nr:radical SAM protein [Bacteroidales bacterium]
MITNFLYCIDYPSKTDGLQETQKLEGWLLCSKKIRSIKILDDLEGLFFNYGISRPDVALHFKDFPGNTACGFTVIAEKAPINLKNKIFLQVEIEDSEAAVKNIKIALDLVLSNIMSIETDDNNQLMIESFQKTEDLFIKTLKKHPWLTIRMDITNKCNLKCIMCHYKEEEISSRPTQAITADQLHHKIKDIAPYVSHIMLSCGFEPLMSKHFHDILSMLNKNYPHIEIAFCTNAMLLNSKARKSVIENDVTHVLLSLDGVTRNTVEKIRVGSSYNKIISNIKALCELKQKNKRNFPVFYINFVLMNSNIHEAPAFVALCASLGVTIIDFRHLVGNIFFSEHDEMLSSNKAKYNYFRKLIIDESNKFNIDVRLPEPYETTDIYTPEPLPIVDLSEFNAIIPDIQSEEVCNRPEIIRKNATDADFQFLSAATCLRPFNEIMIVDHVKIRPCSYYNGSMGTLEGENTLYSIFFNEKFAKLRQRKLNAQFDHNCINCPIKMNLLPTEAVK